MAFFGIEVGKKQVAVAEPLTSVLHITQACIVNPQKDSKAILKIGMQGKDHNLCVLNEQNQFTSLNLFVDPMEVQFSCEGGAKVHLTGYYEPEGEAESDEDMDSEEERELMKELEAQGMDAEDVKKHLQKASGAEEEDSEEEDSEEEEESADEEDIAKAVAAAKKQPKIEAKKMQNEEVESDLEEESDDEDEDDSDDDRTPEEIEAELKAMGMTMSDLDSESESEEPPKKKKKFSKTPERN